MKKTLIAAGFALLTIGFDACSGVIESFPSKTNMLFKLDFEKLRNNSIIAEIRSTNPEIYEMFRGKILTETGIDPEEVKTVWLGGIKKNNGVLVLEGNFDAQKIRKTLSAKQENKMLDRSDCLFAVNYPDKKNDNKINLAALLDQNTIVAGSPEFTDEFIKNYSSDSVAQDFKKKNYLSNGKLLEGVVVAVPQDVVAEKPFMAELETAFFEMDMEKDLVMDLDVNVSDEEQAEAIGKIIDGMVSLQKFMKGKKENDSPIRKEFFDNLSVDISGKKLSASTKISTESIRSEIKKKAKGKLQEF